MPTGIEGKSSPDMDFSPKQLRTIRKPFKDNGFEVWEGTPRSGKTTAGAFRFARFVLECPASDFLVLAYSQEQAYNLLIEGDGNGLRHIFGYNATLHKDQAGSNLAIIHRNFRKRIFFKGAGKANDYKAFQGRGFGGVYFCEINLLNKEVVREAMRRTIASPLRCHFADLNPPSPHHWTTTFFTENKADWTHWTMRDNPILTDRRINAIEETLKGNSYLYARDFLGLRTMPEGLVYGMWDDSLNITESLPEGEEISELWFAADGGVDHATSVICFATTQSIVPASRSWVQQPRHMGACYILDEYYYSGAESGNKAMSLQAKEIEKFVRKCLERYAPHFSRWKVRPLSGWSHFFVDPACLALAEELELVGIPTEKADNNRREGVNAGIERIQDLILRRKVKLLNDRKQGNNHGYFLKELNGYAWDKDGKPVKIHDDVMDAMRYGLNHYISAYGGQGDV